MFATSPPWTAVPLIGGVRDYTSRAASQASVVPDQGFLHPIAVKVSAVGRVDFACNRPVVEDFAALGNLKDLDVLDLYRPVHVILLWIGPYDKIPLAIASVVELVEGDPIKCHQPSESRVRSSSSLDRFVPRQCCLWPLAHEHREYYSCVMEVSFIGTVSFGPFLIFVGAKLVGERILIRVAVKEVAVCHNLGILDGDMHIIHISEVHILEF